MKTNTLCVGALEDERDSSVPMVNCQKNTGRMSPAVVFALAAHPHPSWDVWREGRTVLLLLSLNWDPCSARKHLFPTHWFWRRAYFQSWRRRPVAGRIPRSLNGARPHPRERIHRFRVPEQTTTG